MMQDIFNIYHGKVESYNNGNISEFKEWLKSLSKDELFNFIKWVSREGITL